MAKNNLTTLAENAIKSKTLGTAIYESNSVYMPDSSCKYCKEFWEKRDIDWLQFSKEERRYLLLTCPFCKDR